MDPLASGTYVITNARFFNVAILPNANDHSEIVGGPEESDLHYKWDVSRLKNRKYTIKNYTLHRFAGSGPRTTEGDPIYGGKRKQEWTIKETNVCGQYIISTTDTNLIWGLSDGESNTPIALADVPSDPRNRWTFAPIGDMPQRLLNSVHTHSQGQVITAYETPPTSSMTPHMLQAGHLSQHGSIWTNSSAPHPPLPTSNAHVYIRNLLLKGNGCPLYIPEPSGNSSLYRTKGVRIGDVGFVTDDGYFETLFNIRASVYDPINIRGVPDGFEKIDLHENDMTTLPDYFESGTIIASVIATSDILGLDTSRTIEPVIISNNHRLIWSTSEGAVLHLPHGATRLTCNPELFRDEAIRNGYNWYKYAWQTRRCGVPNGALCLVTGTDKTNTWMVGAFSQTPPGNQVLLNIGTDVAMNENFPCSYSWIGTNPAMRHSKNRPVTRDITVDLADMQQDDAVFCTDAPGGLTHCVFLRGFRISLRQSLWAYLSRRPLPAELSLIQKSAPEDFAGDQDRGQPHSAFSLAFSTISSVFSTWGQGGDNLSGEGRPRRLGSESSSRLPNEEAMVEYVPTALPVDPAATVNDLLLNLVPEAQVSVIHDDEWHSLMQEDDAVFPDSSELVARLNRLYTLDVRTGSVSLRPAETSLKRSSSKSSFPFSPRLSPSDQGSSCNAGDDLYLDPLEILALPQDEGREISTSMPEPSHLPLMKNAVEPSIRTTTAEPQSIVGQLESTSDAHLSSIEREKPADHAKTLFDKIEVDVASNTSLDAVDHLERIECVVDELVSVLEELATQSKSKNLLWQKDTTSRIDKAYQHLSEAVQLFDLGTHSDLVRFQQKDEQARISDMGDFDTTLKLLNQNVGKISEFLGIEKVHMPEAVVALQKHLVSIDNSSEKHVLKQGMHAMQRHSCQARSTPDLFVIAPLDVVVCHDKRLGRGGSADVFEGTWLGNVVAIKMLSKYIPLPAFQHEVDICKQLRHPNILACFGACSTVNPPFFVCALKSNRDAIDFLRRQPTADRAKLLHETSLGLRYLHSNSVIHGDIQGTNILIDEHGTACLCDFGLSIIKHASTVLPTPSFPSGSLQWMSPEQMSVGEISEASDVYSFGITIYEIFTGAPPFAYMSPDLLRINVVNGESRPMRPTDKAVTERGLDDAMWALAEGCWSHEPLARPTSDSVASRLHIRLTSSRTEPVSSTDESCTQSTPRSSIYTGIYRGFTNQDRIIALMGPTGAGKSSFINIATQQDLVVVGHRLESCTQDVQAIVCTHPGVTGLNIVFVDTPGFDDTTRSDHDILKSIVEWLKRTYGAGIKLSGILYFHSIADVRIRGSSLRNLEMFKELCGEEALQNVVFTTSMWDKVTEATGRAREAELREVFWKPFIARGCRMARFFHTYESAWNIVSMFKNPHPCVLRVQKEMVDEGKRLSETSAYQAAIRWWNRIIDKSRGWRRSVRKSSPVGPSNGKRSDRSRAVTRGGSRTRFLSDPQLNEALRQKQELESGAQSDLVLVRSEPGHPEVQVEVSNLRS